jgi:alpha-tubulin suppressor-like RCC1 family protein
MTNRLASKQKKSLWLPLLLGSVCCLLAIGACSVDKSKYTFIPDDEFNGSANAGNGNGNGNGGGANPNGGEGNPGDGDSGAGNADAGVGNSAGSETCIVGEYNCTADGHLQSCKAGMFDDGLDCGDPGRCSATQGVCLKCTPGEFQCANTTLQQCNIFGSAFEDSATCASKAACVANGQKGYCVQCKAATASCEPADIKPTNADNGPVILTDRLLTCNTDGSGTDTTQVCEEESQVCNATSKTCTTCTPGAFVCDGNQLSMCDPDGMNYTFKKQCVSGLLCDAVNGVCKDGPDKCNIGDFNCAGDVLEACDNTGTFQQIDSCASGMCDKNAGRCHACLYSQSSCVNNNVQTCDGSNNADTLVISQSCVANTCTAPGGFAQCGACKPGTIQCYGNSTSYNICGGAFNNLCPTGQVCNPAAVTDPTAAPCVVCSPNRYSCDQNGVLSQCSADGSVDRVLQNCRVPGTNSQCSAAAGKCIPANVGQYTCNDNGDLARVVYDSNHLVTTETTIKDVNKCGSPNLCQPYSGSCNRPRCTVGQTTCQNGDVMSCDNGQQRQRTGAHCATTTRCQDGIGCVKTLAIAAGDAHTCAIVGGPDAVDGDPGMVLCWGANGSGQLGDASPLLSDSKEARQVLVTMTKDGSSSSTSPPVTAPFFSGICAGKSFTCVDINFNQPGVACWGSNANGQLGLNTADPGPYDSPFNGVQDSSGTQTNGALLTNVTCGAEFACALGPDGAAWCWGANDSGQQGTGSIGSPSLAAAPVDGHQFTQLGAGARHVCGIQADNTVWCWGDNSSGQLGTGDTKNSATPVLVGTVTAASDRPLALGNDFSLALATAKSSKFPYSWGANLFGQLGNGTNGDASAAGPLSGLTTAALGDTGTLYAGSTSEHACARIGDTLQCWGANVFGELGDKTTNDNSNPVLIFDGKTNATKLAPGAHSVAVGGRHTCAINANGDVMCWGANHHYQLGSSLLTPQRTPIRGY